MCVTSRPKGCAACAAAHDAEGKGAPKLYSLKIYYHQLISHVCVCWIFRPIPRKEKETCEETRLAKDEGIDLTPQQQFGNECLEVYDVIFGLIQWRFDKLREVCDGFNCVTSEALAVKSVEEQ